MSFVLSRVHIRRSGTVEVVWTRVRGCLSSESRWTKKNWYRGENPKDEWKVRETYQLGKLRRLNVKWARDKLHWLQSLISLTIFLFAFIFTRVEQLVKKVEELHESLQQIHTNHSRDHNNEWLSSVCHSPFNFPATGKQGWRTLTRKTSSVLLTPVWLSPQLTSRGWDQRNEN